MSTSARFVAFAIAGAVACAEHPARADPPPSPRQLAELGRAIFFDPGLSDPPGTSCASCHDPARAFSGTNGSRRGVPRGSRPGHFARRTSPSLLYLRYVPRFRFYQEGDDPQSEPYGGLFWDGRVDTIAELARQPLLNPDEMNNRDGGAVAARVGQAPYGAAFRGAFGAALDDPDATLAAVGRALEAFLITDEMAPFSSPYDDFVRGRTPLAPLAAEGLRLFKDRLKGNCASCHVMDDRARDPARSLFTDYGYEAVGVPRNTAAPPRAPDLGLCERTDTNAPTSDPMYCINFRTPSLRNVAVRESFMHNGAFRSLRDVVAFYATRATNPRRWYPSGVPFDGVPRRYRGHVNRTSPPYDRHVGDPPPLDDHEVDAIVAFLQTLTDARYARLAERTRLRINQD